MDYVGFGHTGFRMSRFRIGCIACLSPAAGLRAPRRLAHAREIQLPVQSVKPLESSRFAGRMNAHAEDADKKVVVRLGTQPRTAKLMKGGALSPLRCDWATC
jgi:ABC-type sugar transport system substrate-binding protein